MPDDQNAPIKAAHQNYRAIPQGIVADEANAVFGVPTGEGNWKPQACAAQAVVENSPPSALLTVAKAGQYEAKFRDPQNGERVEITVSADGSDVGIGVIAHKESFYEHGGSYDPSAFQDLTVHTDIPPTSPLAEDRLKEGPASNSSAGTKASKIAKSVERCMTSEQSPSRTFKRPFFLP